MIARINAAKQQANQIINALNSVRDPDALLQNCLSQPAWAQAMEYVRQNGGDYKAACEKILAENGLDMSCLK